MQKYESIQDLRVQWLYFFFAWAKKSSADFPGKFSIRLAIQEKFSVTTFIHPFSKTM